ncbi:MAG: hypothetical protein BGO04_15065 [Microbacterium sp. 70-38]|nr:MAG: hypothetical protein BGO04_15065 [Microbacterium sp. 70-38]
MRLMAAGDVTIDYTNHRGERSNRAIRPDRIWFGTTQWHADSQWLLEAFDYERSAHRNFALANIHSWTEAS